MDSEKANAGSAPDKGAGAACPDLGALALGSLLMQAKSSEMHRERTAEERRAGIVDLVRAMEISLGDDEGE